MFKAGKATVCRVPPLAGKPACFQKVKTKQCWKALGPWRYSTGFVGVKDKPLLTNDWSCKLHPPENVSCGPNILIGWAYIRIAVEVWHRRLSGAKLAAWCVGNVFSYILKPEEWHPQRTGSLFSMAEVPLSCCLGSWIFMHQWHKWKM